MKEGKCLVVEVKTLKPRPKPKQRELPSAFKDIGAETKVVRYEVDGDSLAFEAI
jgi:hypothetical protein